NSDGNACSSRGRALAFASTSTASRRCRICLSYCRWWYTGHVVGSGASDFFFATDFDEDFFAFGRASRVEWSKDDVRALKAHSKAKTAVVEIVRETGRTVGSLRQQAFKLGIALGHRR